MKIKEFLTLFLAVALLGLNSCKKDSIDSTELLKSVPSSAAGVVVFNLESLLSDAGCKVKDHNVKTGPEIEALINKATGSEQKDLMMLFDGSTGIEPKTAVVFYDAGRTYLTFALYDVKKFCDFIENKNGFKFSDENGVKEGRNIAVKGSQAWVCISSGTGLDSTAISSYSELSPSQSFLVTPMGEKLLVEEDDIRGWALIKTFLNEMLSRGDRSMATLGLGFLFEDPEAVEFKADFESGEIEFEAKVLNSKGKPAKYLLPSEKINVETLKSLGSSCDAMMAFTVNAKLIKKFEQIGAAFGGALFGDLGEALNNVDGTVGIIGSGQGIGRGMNGVITTKGEVSKTLKDFISGQMGPVSTDGKYLRFSQGDVKGSLSVSDCAEELKGCCMGMVFGPSSLVLDSNEPSLQKSFKSFAIKLMPDSESLEFEVEIKTSDPKENSLLTVLKAL